MQPPTAQSRHTTSKGDPQETSLRLLSTEQTATIANASLARLVRPTQARVLIVERGSRLFALNVEAVSSIEPRIWNSDVTLGHIPELKLPTPLKPLTDSSRDVIVNPCGVRARLGVDRVVTTHRLDIGALADPQELIPSGWLLGYFDLGGTTVAMIDPAALLPVRHMAPFAA